MSQNQVAAALVVDPVADPAECLGKALSRDDR
jgi:hypothetical protein